jgi:hypothetical protein
MIDIPYILQSDLRLERLNKRSEPFAADFNTLTTPDRKITLVVLIETANMWVLRKHQHPHAKPFPGSFQDYQGANTSHIATLFILKRAASVVLTLNVRSFLCV